MIYTGVKEYMMAQYRQIQCEFWYKDPEVCEQFTPEDKYFYIYLFTNPHTRQCGIYEISTKHMVIETGYGEEKIEELIDRFENKFKKIRYNRQTKEIAIKNWMKHNAIKSPKVYACIDKELRQVKDKSLIDYVFNGIDTVYIPYFQSKKTDGEEYKNKNKNKRKEDQSKDKDSAFFNAVDQYFKDNSKVYYRDAKESKHIKDLEVKLKTFDVFLPLATSFKALTESTDAFWRQQPLIPSAMNSLLSRIKQTQQSKPKPQTMKEFYG